MSTHIDEPQEPTTQDGGTHYDGDLMPFNLAWLAYHRDWQSWIRTELAAARTRIAEAEGELAGVAGELQQVRHENERLREERDREADLRITAMAAASRFARPGDTVAATIGRMEDKIIDLAGECVETAAQRDAATATAEALRWMLQKHQYEVSASGGLACVECGHSKTHDGRHYPDCALAAALATTDTDSTGGETT